jgi:hypothetical protein
MQILINGLVSGSAIALVALAFQSIYLTYWGNLSGRAKGKRFHPAWHGLCLRNRPLVSGCNVSSHTTVKARPILVGKFVLDSSHHRHSKKFESVEQCQHAQRQ